jgi:Gram-negative bacterial TonB protein C-terminal
MALRWYEEITYYDHLYVYSHGTVTARFTVTPDGTFHDPHILANTSNPLMANAVIRAIRRAWIGRFPAAVLARAPDGLVIEQTFRFWDNDPTEYGLASSYPQLLTRRSPEIGAAQNIDLRKFFDLSKFRFQSRIIETTAANGSLASR